MRVAVRPVLLVVGRLVDKMRPIPKFKRSMICPVCGNKIWFGGKERPYCLHCNWSEKQYLNDKVSSMGIKLPRRLRLAEQKMR